MNLFYKRPLASVASVFMAGSFFFFLLPTAARITLGVLCLFCGILLLFCKVRRIFPALLLSAALGAALMTLYFDVIRLPYQSYEGEHVTVIGNIAEISYRNDSYYSLALSCDAIDGEPYTLRLSAECLSETELTVGDRIVLCGDFKLLRARDFFDESLSYPLTEGVTAILENAYIRDLRSEKTALSVFVRLRDLFAGRIEDAVSGESGHLLSTLLLGAYTVSGKTVVDFRYTGLLPLLAISGTHFTVLSFSLLYLLKRLHVGMRKRTLLLLFFLVFYTALSGFLPSVMRAALMLICSLFGYLTGRPYDPLTGLCLSASGLLLCFPYLIGNTGFLLSVTATFGILFFGEAVQKTRFDPYRIENPILHALYAPLLLTASAITATLPVAAFLCGEVSLLSFPGNLLLSPIMDILLFLAGALVILPIPPLAAIADLVGRGLLFALAKLASIPNMLLSLRPWPIQILLLACVLWLILSLGILPKKKAHPMRSVSALLACVLVYASLYPVTSRIGLRYIYTAKEGQGMLTLYGGSSAVLYDCTDNYSHSLYLAARDARKHAIPELDAVILSNYHERQPIDLRKTASYMKIRRLILPHPTTEEERHLAAKLCDVADIYDIRLTFYTPSAVIRIGDMTCIHHPRTGDARLISFCQGDKTVTYMSTSYYQGIEHATARRAIAESDLLILGAFGSNEKVGFPYPVPDGEAPRILVSDPLLSEEWKTKGLPERLQACEVALDVTEERGYVFH